jgi:hydrogenase expression/formation protein HypD
MGPSGGVTGMKHLDEYRSATASRVLVEQIRAATPQPLCLMEVCGGQTHSLLSHGITQALKGHVEFIHGPGCPVCVTSIEDIDEAIRLAHSRDTQLVTFGDMLRVPGAKGTLAQARGAGADVQLIYSPLDAVQRARENPELTIVFFAVGFETTVPATALAIQQAAELGLNNFRVLCSHVRVIPAMEMILRDHDCRIDGFLAAGHVCSVHGTAPYESLAQQFQIPIVVAGFEPVDLLRAILASAIQIKNRDFGVVNHYQRYVEHDGNPLALHAMEQVFSVSDRNWRGLGLLQGGGFEIQPPFQNFDARALELGLRDGEPVSTASSLESRQSSQHQECPSGAVLRGQLKPCDCPHFGRSCTPEHPLGAPMVSSEGACAAYYRVTV